MTIRIILADDHTILRQGLKSLLEEEPDFQIVGEAGNGLEALQLVEHLKPDVLVVDVMMPRMNGLEVIRQANVRCPGIKIIVLSMHDREAYIMEAIRNGASAYVLKDSAGYRPGQCNPRCHPGTAFPKRSAFGTIDR